MREKRPCSLVTVLFLIRVSRDYLKMTHLIGPKWWQGQSDADKDELMEEGEGGGEESKRDIYSTQGEKSLQAHDANANTKNTAK